jgi:cytochrome c oxidase cbb3-type subunit 4
MIKDLLTSLDYSDCAELALALFVGAFVVIIYGTMRLSREASHRFASIPLSDQVEDPRSE